MRNKAAGRLLCLCLAWASLSPPTAFAADPLSAIDWLDVPPATDIPLTQPLSETEGADLEAPATQDARVPDVAVVPLGDASAAGVGLLASAVSGLPTSLWENSDAADLARALDALPSQSLIPAAQSLSLTMLLAEARPPRGDDDRFLAARLDALIRRGAIAPARELAALLPPGTSSDILLRQADIALLEGDTDRICPTILRYGASGTGLGLQVYCAARTGAWAQAATVLEASYALGDIPNGQYHRLLRFLDPDFADILPDLPPPPLARLTALEYRLLVASGTPVPTATLPLPFAVAELSGDAGWRPRIEAAERLVRAGALSESQLFAAYTHRMPAASGGVWTRVEAYQRLETALAAGAPDAIGRALTQAWPIFLQHGLAVPLARNIGPKLSGIPLSPPAQKRANAAMLLSPQYETLARQLKDRGAAQDAEDAFAIGLAMGQPSDPPDALARAIATAWTSSRPSPPAGGRTELGLTLLQGLLTLEAGAEGDLRAVTESLTLLRAFGLEDMARRAALQLWLGQAPA